MPSPMTRNTPGSTSSVTRRDSRSSFEIGDGEMAPAPGTADHPLLHGARQEEPAEQRDDGSGRDEGEGVGRALQGTPAQRRQPTVLLRAEVDQRSHVGDAGRAQPIGLT